MKTALTLSGGGSNGIAQIGALDALFEREGYIDFDIVAGVSTGALNGVMIAQNKYPRLQQIWKTIRTEQVFKHTSDFWVGVRLLLGGKSMYDFSPLMQLIEENVFAQDLVKTFFAGTVDMETGIYHKVSQFPTNQELRQAVYCSSIMPILWEPSDFGQYRNMADGGLRNIAPLADVIDELPDKIYIICCQPRSLQPKKLNSFMDYTKRTLEILTSEIIHDDLDKLLTINDLVLQAREQGALLVNRKTGKSYKYFETVILRPEEVLGDSTDFSRKHLDETYEKGLRFIPTST